VIYETLHPEAKAATGVELANKRWNAADKLSVASYATDAAAATGDSERTVRRQTKIGEVLGDLKNQLKGTPSDSI